MYCLKKLFFFLLDLTILSKLNFESVTISFKIHWNVQRVNLRQVAVRALIRRTAKIAVPRISEPVRNYGPSLVHVIGPRGSYG